ncbi:MAG TPA: HPr(Ser) kinase/phosphatase [Thermoanaerobaculia bacterium]|nr:HPr(Ser) kinase/phosphatase [Thermoanaerobaculia bacterium]HUM29966.1 HPr(Ser) kinase/phosphatase [Thermoanaerobaculia bacterium]HXK68167.1 HPr(Ser) kinase/phosphatase [Thermoanaerobaculia bacterium]
MKETIPVSARVLLNKELEDLQLRLIGGKEGLNRIIERPRPQKPGLALAGFTKAVKENRVQIIGTMELDYLETMSEEKRKVRVDTLCQQSISAIVLSRDHPPPPELLDACNSGDIPLFSSPASSGRLIERLTYFLQDQLAPRRTVSGDLVDVYGLGVLITGKSSVGKSECALELVKRGHRLVSDDVVMVRRFPNDVLIGRPGNERIRNRLEIRGIGIINVHHMFGVTAVAPEKTIDLVIDLQHWDETIEYDRLGADAKSARILDVEIPLIEMPVSPGRNIALLVEIATRAKLLKNMGYDEPKEFIDKLQEDLIRNARS